MNITRETMNKAVAAKIITQEQLEQLIQFIKQQPGQSNGFNLTNVLYYLGGLIAIGAMSLFMTLGWELLGGWGILFISLCYAILGLSLTHLFAHKELTIPAGICATFVVCLTPLAIYGLQQGMGWWPDDTVFREYNYYIKWHWIFMELGTLAVGVILLWIYRYPFMTMPIAVTLWYMSMDLTSMISGGEYVFGLSAMVSMYFGLLTALIAFGVDIRSRQSADYAFWLYLFGVLAFWGGLTAQHSDYELSKFIYLCINLMMILIGIILTRKVFTVFGGVGVCIYISHLAYHIFQDSYLFPVILTVIGLSIIYLGILWQKNETRMTVSMRKILPKPLQELLDARDQLD
ncbi:hypothetical protein [Legionella drancourtii]|uniref:Membrane protein n=1 Tax=Legionella drancourtii LLAP12 TaxID=658187 RepID=G9EPL6_9GAMM|nr:hypothetical protein [Legionella drancourtii]EHL30789.1 membrane protein [Legionella drancourtii LLAP12]